ncbi:MAG: 3-oxoacyl-[acyl-carrier-protein] reductase [Ignavibacteriae bacterium]|nr:3-oxoacyl-[acyl-carrier-protein] reductase [Ignavibacteriota bacterium]
MRLENKVAIITGAGRGIGKATALRFADEGATIAVVDIDEKLGNATAAEVMAKGRKAIFCKVNVADHQQTEEMAKKTHGEFGRIDILVNNAGITRDATLAKMTSEQFDQVIDVNLKGVFNCTKAVVPFMVEKNYGRIINTSSVVGIYGNFGQTNYVATKAGVIGMTKVWAREFGRKGITVNAVEPGFIATEIVGSVPEKVLTAIKEKTPLQRLGDPVDIANAYLFLASDEAAFITGAVLSVDGGMVG